MSEINREVGERPQLEWVSVDLIDVDNNYQRELKTSLVEKILRRFAWSKFGALVLSRQENGRFTVVEGQHRWKAACLHPDISEVPAVIVSHADLAGEASSYRTYTGADPDPFASMTEYQLGADWYAWAEANTSGKKADFKVRFFNDDEEGSYYSPLKTVDPMVIDTSAPAKPTLNVVTEPGGESYTFTVTASHDSIHVVRLRITRDGATIAQADVRPGQTASASFMVFRDPSRAKQIEINAYAYASGGAESAPETRTVTVPRLPD